jgi:hypothetical protein
MSNNKRKHAVVIHDTTSAEVVLQPDAVSDNSMVSEHSMVMIKFESASDSPATQPGETTPSYSQTSGGCASD